MTVYPQEYTLQKQDFMVNATGPRAVELRSILTDESLSGINDLSLLGGRDIKVSVNKFASLLVDCYIPCI